MKKKEKRIVVIGAGMGGMAAAALLAKRGFDVTVLEKNSQTGGKARLWEKEGFRFDMGPSWYLMPEVFEHFFSLFGKSHNDYYTLEKLDPSYKVFFGHDEAVEISPDIRKVAELFESFERGGGERLKQYLQQAEYKYTIAMKEFLYRNYRSLFDFFNRRVLGEGLRLNVLKRLDRVVHSYFHDRRAVQILEYPMVFLGTDPHKAPALYSIMSHVDLNAGVYYPKGGMAAVASAIHRLADSEGVRLLTEQEVQRVAGESSRAKKVITQKQTFEADLLVINADYVHAETRLLDERLISISHRYWKRRVIAPSMFLLYLGIRKRLKSIAHHNLYFSPDWEKHFDAIFRKPSWPKDPCFYLSCISHTDPDMAPEGHENLFVLVPMAPGMDDTDEVRERYAQEVVSHVEKIIGESISDSIVVRRIYSHRDFVRDYNAYRGTALGLAHTLRQTAVFRPPFQSKRARNLYYVGQYTHPGIGVPMVLISAQILSSLIQGTGE